MCLPGTAEVIHHQVEPEDRHHLGRRRLLTGAVVAAPALAFSTPAHADDRRSRCRLQDLTHVVTEDFPVFAFDQPAREGQATIPGDGFYSQRWTLGEHSGTHMDAPGHFIPGGRLAPDITAQELLAPMVVLDITDRAARDPDTVVTVDDLIRFERRHGRIPRGALVCMNSGWAAKVTDPLAYKGGPSFPDYHFPGFGTEAAIWLAEHRDVTGLGVDTLSLDPGNSTTFPTHLQFLGTDRYGLENLNNLHKVPPRGARAFVGLIPWKKGSGGPCRVIATW
jgi:kynurenine formamidase